MVATSRAHTGRQVGQVALGGRVEHGPTGAGFLPTGGPEVETTDMLRIKTTGDIASCLGGNVPDEATVIDRHAPLSTAEVGPDMDATTSTFMRLAAGPDAASAWEAETPPPRRGQLLSDRRRRWPWLLLAAAVL